MNSEFLDKYSSLDASNPNELRSFLIKFAKADRSIVTIHRDIYSAALTHTDDHVKIAAITSIFYVAELKDEDLLVPVYEIVSNHENWDDLLSWSVTALSIVFGNKKNKRVIQMINRLWTKKAKSGYISLSCIKALLSIHCKEWGDRASKFHPRQTSLSKQSTLLAEMFSDELEEIESFYDLILPN